MRMTDERSLGRVAAVFDCERLFEIRLRSFKRGHELIAVNVVGRLVNLPEDIFELIYYGREPDRVLRQMLDNLIKCAKIKIKLLDIIVLDADIYALI